MASRATDIGIGIGLAGIADASLLPTWLLCGAARKRVTVALGGDGADELFAGYASFKANKIAHCLSAIPSSFGAAFRAGLS